MKTALFSYESQLICLFIFSHRENIITELKLDLLNNIVVYSYGNIIDYCDVN